MCFIFVGELGYNSPSYLLLCLMNPNHPTNSLKPALFQDQTFMTILERFVNSVCAILATIHPNNPTTLNLPKSRNLSISQSKFKC